MVVYIVQKNDQIRIRIRIRLRVDTIIFFDGMSCEIVCMLFVPLTLLPCTIHSSIKFVLLFCIAKLCVRMHGIVNAKLRKKSCP